MRPPPLGDLALVTAAPLPVGPARGRSLAAGMGEAFTNERLHTPSSSDHAPPESQRHGPRHDGARRVSDASPSRLPEPRRRLEEADVNRSPRPASLAVLTADRLRLRLSLRTAGRRDRRDPRPPCRWWPARARGAPAPARSTSSQLRLPSDCRASVRGPIDRAVLTVVQKRESSVGAGVPPVAIGNARGLEVVVDVLSRLAVRLAPRARVIGATGAARARSKAGWAGSRPPPSPGSPRSGSRSGKPASSAISPSRSRAGPGSGVAFASAPAASRQGSGAAGSRPTCGWGCGPHPRRFRSGGQAVTSSIEPVWASPEAIAKDHPHAPAPTVPWRRPLGVARRTTTADTLMSVSSSTFHHYGEPCADAATRLRSVRGRRSRLTGAVAAGVPSHSAGMKSARVSRPCAAAPQNSLSSTEMTSRASALASR